MTVSTPQTAGSPAIIQVDGPLVGGKTTTLTILSVAQLRGSDYLTPLYTTINAAFRHMNQTLPPAEGGYRDRLLSAEDFLVSLHEDPETFTLILCLAGTQHAIATASCRRHRHVDQTALHIPWTRKLEPEAGSVEWEVKMLAVDPAIQRQGLARFMMETVEREAVRRAQALAGGIDHDAPMTKVRMTLVAVKEATQEFYLKAGYAVDYEVPRGPGFTTNIISMSKTLWQRE